MIDSGLLIVLFLLVGAISMLAGSTIEGLVTKKYLKKACQELKYDYPALERKMKEIM